jgi:hypothetical protein
MSLWFGGCVTCRCSASQYFLPRWCTFKSAEGVSGSFSTNLFFFPDPTLTALSLLQTSRVVRKAITHTRENGFRF